MSGQRQYPNPNNDEFRKGLESRIAVGTKLQELEEKTGQSLTEEKMMEVLTKAGEIQEREEKRKKERKTLKNAIEDDFSKGAARNQPCPLCNKKLKKCKCGFLMK